MIRLVQELDGVIGIQVERGISLQPPGDSITAVVSDRSVLTAGVLITLALIPTATLVGMTLVAGDFALLGRSLLRWLVDVALVAGMGVPVFIRHRSRLGRRRSML